MIYVRIISFITWFRFSESKSLIQKNDGFCSNVYFCLAERFLLAASDSCRLAKFRNQTKVRYTFV